MHHVAKARIAAQHPCLPGHFPGRPVVPAVVMLDEVQAALAVALGAPARLAALPAVKFLRPLDPGVEFDIVLDIDRDKKTATFRCSAAGAELANGRLGYADG